MNNSIYHFLGSNFSNNNTSCDTRTRWTNFSCDTRILLWRNCESGCLCLSAWWYLVSFAHSQPCLSFIVNVLYRRRSDHTWYNKGKEIEGQWLVKRLHRWSITVNNRYTGEQVLGAPDPPTYSPPTTVVGLNSLLDVLQSSISLLQNRVLREIVVRLNQTTTEAEDNILSNERTTITTTLSSPRTPPQ